MRRTVDDDLPHEIDYLRRHDQTIHRIMETAETSARPAENHVLSQNEGRLSSKRREDEYRQLCDDEVGSVERIAADTFDGVDDAPGEVATTPAED